MTEDRRRRFRLLPGCTVTATQQYEPADHADLPLQKRQGAAIKIARLRKGWTQKELAERVGKSTSTISNIENGRHVPSTANGLNRGTLKLFAFALGIPEADLTNLENS